MQSAAGDAGDPRGGQGERRLVQPVDVIRHQPVRRKGDDAVGRQFGGLDHALIGVLAELERRSGIDPERGGDCAQFFGRIGQARQIGEIDVENAGRQAAAQFEGRPMRDRRAGTAASSGGPSVPG